jgi:hypothetical protein
MRSGDGLAPRLDPSADADPTTPCGFDSSLRFAGRAAADGAGRYALATSAAIIKG